MYVFCKIFKILNWQENVNYCKQYLIKTTQNNSIKAIFNHLK